MKKKPPWRFLATCNECGTEVPVNVMGGTFHREGDDLAYTVTLERTEIEMHLLTAHGRIDE